MKVRIEIDTKTFVRFWLVVIGFALAILLIYKARTALTIIGVSIFLALALNPPVAKIARRLPGRSRVAATALSYVAVVLILTAFLALVIPPIIEQSVHFAQTVPALLDSATNRWGGASELINRYGIQDQVNQAVVSIQENATSWARNIGASVISGAGSLFSAVAAILIVFVLTFLMLIEGPEWIKRIWSLYRDKNRMEHHRTIAHKMYRVVNGYVTGQLTVALAAATSSAIAVFLLSLFFDLPSNLAMPTAALIFIGAMIPMFGATIGGTIVAILIAFNDITAAVIFIVFFIIYQQIENNVISPLIQSKTVNLSALVVLISVTTGIYLFGLAGGIISIPIAGCIQVLVMDYLDRTKSKQTENHKSFKKIARRIKGESTS